MRKYVCSDLKIYTQPDTFRYRQVLICPMHNFLSPPSGGGYVSHREFRRRCYQNNRVPPPLPPPLPRRPPPPPRASSPLGPVCENLHSPPEIRYGQLAKICTGNLTGSGLRKYALRQNHTIPVCFSYTPALEQRGDVEVV